MRSSRLSLSDALVRARQSDQSAAFRAMDRLIGRTLCLARQSRYTRSQRDDLLIRVLSISYPAWAKAVKTGNYNEVLDPP